MRVSDQQLKAFLLDAGLVTESQLAKAEAEVKKQQRRLGDVLVRGGVVKPEDLARLQAYILGIPFVSLEKENIPRAVLEIIPETVAREHNIVVFRKSGGNLEVAMLDPEDLQTIEFVKKKSNLKILPRLTNEISIKNVLQQYQKPLQAEFGEIIDGELKATIETGVAPDEDLEKSAKELPIIRIVDALLKHAILQKASDIHIEPYEKEVVVRYRIDGLLRDVMVLPKQVASGIVARIKILSNLKLDEHRLPQDGRFKVETDDYSERDAHSSFAYKISFRVSILPVYDGEKIVMRLLPEDSKGFTLERLGFLKKQIEIVERNIKKPNGLFLVTGPTGCGKTTTLYTMMDILNVPEVNISTVEDPIEYRIPRVNQTQVSPRIGLTFANGLRSLLRQDPDILMVGEIRDDETASLAINAALTGHLVLSTLHTNSAAGSLPRLIDMKVEPFLIASTVDCIIAQRLVRTLNPDTKEKYQLSDSEVKHLSDRFNLDSVLTVLKREGLIGPKATFKTIEFYRPKESPDCPDGYKGRMGVHEVLEVTSATREMIIKGATADQIEEQAKAAGMVTMLEDGFIKAAQGITSIEEILRVTKE
ncbi:MAG: Flp pilus assembly complex ATPase component TadA [Candidatus Portnoybacteria bacterium]|nr:Flp pilus assembly complex ATPase component TadA [Candidatus Portnoybacteria bacterium]